MHIRKVSFMLVTVFLCSSFVSCNSPSTDSTESIAQSEETTTVEVPTEETSVEAELETDFYKDKLVLSWVYNDVVYVSDEVEYQINKRLDELGKDYVIDFVQIGESTFEKTINQEIASNQAPALITAGFGANGECTGTYRAYRDGWLLDLSDYLATDDGQILWNSVPEACWKASSVNGGYYGLSTMQPFSTDYVYYVNADLLQQLGLTEDDLAGKGIDELQEYLALVDQSQYCVLCNATALEYTDIVGIDSIVGTQNCQSSVICYDRAEQKAVSVYDSQTARKWFQTIQEYKEDNYLQEDLDNFFIYVGALDAFESDVEEQARADIARKFPDAENVITVPYAKVSLASNFNAISGVCAQSDDQEAALDALTTIMTDESLSNLLIYGIEGVNYTMLEDHTVQVDSYSWVYSMYFGNTFVSTPESGIAVDTFQEYEDMEQTKLLGQYFDLTEYQEEMDAINQIADQYTGLLRGEYDDVDGTLAEAQKQVQDAGIQEILDRINDQIQ